MSKKHEEHVDESWLIPYADILTLLLALFIVLFAASNIDQAKFDAIMEAFYSSFSGVLPEREPGTGKDEPGASLPPLLASQSPSPTPGPEKPGKPEALEKLYGSLISYIEMNDLGDTISVDYKGENVLVILISDVWFVSGSAEVTREMREESVVLANLIKDNQNPDDPFDVIVTGHTDNLPIKTQKYPSNWYLSMDRAVNFMVALIADGDLDPTHFSARGYGEFKPVATNDTEEGRQKNRRVELLVSMSILVEDAVEGMP